MVAPEQLGFRTGSAFETGRAREYPENFGNKEAEEIAMDVLEQLPGLEVEKASKEEDQKQGIDFWVILKSSGKRVPVQFTMSGSREKLFEKRSKLVRGQILIDAEKESFAQAWEEYQKDKEKNPDIKLADKLPIKAQKEIIAGFIRGLWPSEQEDLAAQAEWYFREKE
jgi:hypothetical protein